MNVVKTEITVLNNQSIQDISIQHTGTVDNALTIALFNNINPTDLLRPGQKINLPDGLIIDTTVLKEYQKKSYEPATGLTRSIVDTITGCQGIGCWRIENDFIIS